MRFLVDAQLPPSLARFLAEHGEQATACRDVGLRDADDDEIWQFAIAGGWCVIPRACALRLAGGRQQAPGQK